MSPLLWWVSIAIICLLIEFMTTSLYGFVAAVGCLIAAIVTYFMGGEYHVVQLYVCLVITAIGCFIVPRFFKTTGIALQTGLDAYIGEKTSIKIVDGKAKIVLDGVERLVLADRELADGDVVTIVEKRGTKLFVK